MFIIFFCYIFNDDDCIRGLLSWKGRKLQKERERERGKGQDYWEGNRKWKLLSLVFLLREEKDMMMANDLSSVARVCQRTLNKHRETEKEGQQRRGTQKTNKSKRMIPVMNLCQLCTKFSFTWITVFFKIVERERENEIKVALLYLYQPSSQNKLQRVGWVPLQGQLL